MSTTSSSSFFTLVNDVVSGPADYMAERYAQYMASIYAGNCQVFNYGVRHKGLTIDAAILLCLHTDYNSWHTTRSFAKQHGLM